MKTCVLVFMILFVLSGVVSFAEGYKNYTVGESLGWYDVLENPKVDYQKWADKINNFSLGDFLIFNTDNNHSITQTYNFTIYKLCDDSDAINNETIEWSSADPSSTTPHPISIPVPLVKVGTTYFFSSDYDGEQCQNGQHFKINVTRGQGLPPSLREPDDSPAPIGPESGDDESVPDTIVPSNFDHPKDMDDDEDDGSKPSMAVSLIALSKFFGIQLHALLIVAGFLSFN